MIYDPVAHKLILKGGMTLRFDYQDPVRTEMRFATRVQDTSGNYLEIAYGSGGGRISTIQDTLGNTYTFLLNSQGRLAYISYFNTNDTTQPTSTVALEYDSQGITFGPEAVTASLPAQEFLAHVTYISGVRYNFLYGSSGELSEITYPTFGTSRYFYSTYSVLERFLNQSVPDHYISSHDTGEGSGVWRWINGPGSGQAAPTGAIIWDPENQGPSYFINIYMGKAGSSWADGFVMNEKIMDQLPSYQMSVESQQDWTQDDTQLTTIKNPRVAWTQQVSTGGVLRPETQTVTRSEFTYASATDYSGNVKEIREYAWNGSLRRKSTFNYLHESNSAYVPLNILDKVTDTLLYDGASHLISKSFDRLRLGLPSLCCLRGHSS